MDEGDVRLLRFIYSGYSGVSSIQYIYVLMLILDLMLLIGPNLYKFVTSMFKYSVMQQILMMDNQII